MKTKTVQVLFDPGHAWGRVKKSELVELGIADKISDYSYQRGEYAYLEEDCDLTLYINTLKAAGVEFKFKEAGAKTRQSKIRGYDSYVTPREVFLREHVLVVRVQ